MLSLWVKTCPSIDNCFPTMCNRIPCVFRCLHCIILVRFVFVVYVCILIVRFRSVFLYCSWCHFNCRFVDIVLHSNGFHSRFTVSRLNKFLKKETLCIFCCQVSFPLSSFVVVCFFVRQSHPMRKSLFGAKSTLSLCVSPLTHCIRCANRSARFRIARRQTRFIQSTLVGGSVRRQFCPSVPLVKLVVCIEAYRSSDRNHCSPSAVNVNRWRTNCRRLSASFIKSCADIADKRRISGTRSRMSLRNHTTPCGARPLGCIHASSSAASLSASSDHSWALRQASLVGSSSRMYTVSCSVSIFKTTLLYSIKRGSRALQPPALNGNYCGICWRFLPTSINI